MVAQASTTASSSGGSLPLMGTDAEKAAAAAAAGAPAGTTQGHHHGHPHAHPAPHPHEMHAPEPHEGPIPLEVVATMDEADQALAALGYTPVFKREFSLWSCFSFALSISGLFATIMTTFSYPLIAGGAASVIWMWLFSGAGGMFLALSIAEISSAYPTSGAMYFTLRFLAPPDYVAVIAWVTGWLNLIGTITGTASSEYGAAQMLLSAVSIGTDFRYRPTQGHVIGVMAGLTIMHAAINSLSTSWLNKLSSTYAVVHIAVLIACAAVLLAMQHDKHSAQYVFTNLEPHSGWEPPAFSLWFGSLASAWIMTNCDGVAHIAEEAKDPARVVPLAIVSSQTFTFIGGFLFNLALVFCMGDPTRLLESVAGQPVTQMFYDVMGPSAAIFFVVAGFVVMNFLCIPSIQAGSRTLWAFARDEMVPGSRFLYRIWRRTSTPMNSIWVYSVLCVLINLIGLGDHIIIAAVFNICAIALNISYCVPIVCKLLYGRFERGPFHLGRFSTAINIVSCVFTAFMSVIFVLPTMRPVTAKNMNYAAAIVVAVLLFAVSYWYLGGRKYYEGPRTTARFDVDGNLIHPAPQPKADAEVPAP